MTILPYLDRIIITDPPAEQIGKLELPPGVHVEMQRGIITQVGSDVEVLDIGDLIWFACNHDHMKIGDLTVLGAPCVVAYEKFDGGESGDRATA